VGRPIGLAWTPHWSSGVWHIASNITGDLVGNGTSLIGHPVEEPFAWYAPPSPSNPATTGSFHMLFHAFQMGMVNNSGATMPGPGTVASSSVKGQALRRIGNAYGAYANAPTPFGPWRYQEARVAYSGVIELEDGSTFGLLRRTSS